MPIARQRHIIYFFLIFLFALGLPFPEQIAHASPIPPQDVVIVVDSSESASPYLPSIANILSRFVGGAGLGDSFICYRFSSNPILIAKGRISAPGQISQLKEQVLHLRTDGKYTNYSPALEKALADINASFVSHPENERVLILITDGRRYRADTRGENAGLRELTKSYSGLRAGRDYTFSCFYIGGMVENDLQSYLSSVGAQIAHWPEDESALAELVLGNIRVMSPPIHLREVSDARSQSPFPISFYPRRPPQYTSSIEVGLKTKFSGETLDKYAAVSPRRIFAQSEQWSELFTLETRGFERGNYAGTLVFRALSPHTLIISPSTVDLAFTVAEPLDIVVPEPLTFGPTGFSGDYKEQKVIAIVPGRVEFPEAANAISVAVDIDLPDELEVKVSPSYAKTEILVKVTVSRNRAVSQQLQGNYKGILRLSSPGSWAFKDDEIPFSVKIGRRGINYRAIGAYFGWMVVGLVALGLFLLVFRGTRIGVLDYFAHKTYPVGKLVLTHDPTRGIARNINIARLCEKKRNKEISVGVGRGVDVDLPHKSMLDINYTFWGLRAKDDVHTIAEARKGTDAVIVNEISRTGRVKLEHFNNVRLGEFVYRFEVPTPLSQAVLYLLSGEVWQGWPLTWKTDADGFRFLSRDSLPQRKESYIRFFELKAAAFVRDFEGELTRKLLKTKVPRSGHLIKVVFADDESLTGYVFDWKNPGEKFYLLPNSLGDNVMFFLIEKTTLKDISLIREDNAGARRARRRFARLLEQLDRRIGI